MPHPLIVTIATVIAGLVLKRIWTGLHSSAGLPTPPGPTPRWLVGNLLDVPLVRPWETYRKWCEEYGESTRVPLFLSRLIPFRDAGDVVYLHLPVKSILILGSMKAANDLLDSRSHIYSDRPYSVMVEL